MHGENRKEEHRPIFKSILRLGASYGLCMTGDMMLMTVGVLLGLAEVLGIIEEVV